MSKSSNETTSTGNAVLRLKKGDLLFKEGEKSRAMYLLKSGAIRLFMRRGDSNIEIDTIRQGQILGELAFLDGNPRSVSGEALTDCELAEISVPMFMQVLAGTPEWLKILLKTVVGRLRAANSKIRQLETANVAIDYSDPSQAGKRQSQYQFLSQVEFLKVATALLVAGSRSKKSSAAGPDVGIGTINLYANNIMGVPVSKTSSAIDILVHLGVAQLSDQSGNPRVILKDLNALEQLIHTLNEENQLETSKKHIISTRGLSALEVITKNLASFPIDQATQQSKVNVALLRQPAGSESPLFNFEDLAELARTGITSDLKVQSNTEAFIFCNPMDAINIYRMLVAQRAIVDLNEQKRKIR